MRLIKPPSFSMSRSPVETISAPAPKKRTLLNNIWFSAWNSAAVSAKAAAPARPLALKARARPMAMKMMPTFSIVL